MIIALSLWSRAHQQGRACEVVVMWRLLRLIGWKNLQVVAYMTYALSLCFLLASNSFLDTLLVAFLQHFGHLQTTSAVRGHRSRRQGTNIVVLRLLDTECSNGTSSVLLGLCLHLVVVPIPTVRVITWGGRLSQLLGFSHDCIRLLHLVSCRLFL